MSPARILTGVGRQLWLNTIRTKQHGGCRRLMCRVVGYIPLRPSSHTVFTNTPIPMHVLMTPDPPQFSQVPTPRTKDTYSHYIPLSSHASHAVQWMNYALQASLIPDHAFSTDILYISLAFVCVSTFPTLPGIFPFQRYTKSFSLSTSSCYTEYQIPDTRQSSLFSFFLLLVALESTAVIRL